MVFRIKTQIVLKRDFEIEAETPKKAMEEIKRQVYEDIDLNSLEIAEIGYDITDPSIREYNAKICREQIVECMKKKRIQ